MTDYHWHLLRARAIDQFAEAPSAELEQQILEHFAERPALVDTLIDQIGHDVKNGKIRSGWAVLRRRLNDAANAPTATATDERDRDRRIANAKTWIRHAGLYLDRWDEVAVELFGQPEITAPLEFLEQHELDTRERPGRRLYNGLLNAAIRHTREHGQEEIPNTGGILRAYANNTTIVDQMHAYWIEHRPHGQLAERESDEWQSGLRANRERALAKKAKPGHSGSNPDAPGQSGEQPEPEPAPVGAPDDDINFDE